MALKFYKEHFVDIMGELPELFVEHFKVVKDKDYKELDIDWNKYVELEQNSLLHVLTARNDTNRLVGYVFTICLPHILYKSILHGFGDIYFLLPEYRKGFAGIKMLKENAKMLKHMGVKRHCISVNEGYNIIKKLLIFLGYTPWEQTFSKRLS